jgi:hypothetical protein
VEAFWNASAVVNGGCHSRAHPSSSNVAGWEAGQLLERDQVYNLGALYIQNHQTKKLIVVCPSLPPIESERLLIARLSREHQGGLGLCLHVSSRKIHFISFRMPDQRSGH